jgi:hypothetical protein
VQPVAMPRLESGRFGQKRGHPRERDSAKRAGGYTEAAVPGFMSKSLSSGLGDPAHDESVVLRRL